jgi:hypothetical protein
VQTLEQTGEGDDASACWAGLLSFGCLAGRAAGRSRPGPTIPNDLHFADVEAAWGEFPELASWAKEQGICLRRANHESSLRHVGYPGRRPLHYRNRADRIRVSPLSPRSGRATSVRWHTGSGREIYTPRRANDDEAVSTQSLATYAERLLEVRRDFTLYDDRVVVRARWFLNRRFEHVVKLAALKGDFQEITIRYRMYRYAGWLMAIGALAYAACYYNTQNMALRAVGYLALSVTIFGAVCMTLTYQHRRIRFARFYTQAGRIGLDIGSAGNDIATFEKFVHQVRWQIHR